MPGQSAYEGGKVVSPKPCPPLTPSKYLLYSFLVEAKSPQGHSAAKRIKLIKYFYDTVGNRTRDLPACSTIPQPTASPHVPFL